MSDINTSQTLMKIGAWLQIPFSLLLIAIGAWLLWLLLPVIIDPMFWVTFGIFILLILSFVIVTGIIGFILTIIWFRWQHDILGHKKGLITTGIIGIIFTGTVPGLLVLLAAALYPTK
jgi:hypothetical protein